MRSLIWMFAGHMLNSQGCNVPSCRQRRLWSDWADAQDSLSLRWAIMSEDAFFSQCGLYDSISETRKSYNLIMYPLWTFSLNICCCFLINRIKYMNKSQIFYADIIFHDWVRIMDRRHLYSTLSLNRTVGKRNYQNNANVVTWSVISANWEMLSMLGRIYSRRHNKLFSYFFPENRIWYSCQILFCENNEIYIQFVVCWFSPKSSKGWLCQRPIHQRKYKEQHVSYIYVLFKWQKFCF